MADEKFNIEWDKTGERIYETGIDRGVLYPMGDGGYANGVAWNGLTNVSENPSGAESTPLYADNTKYLNLLSVEEFGATIEAYTYPEEFEECDGSASIAKGVSIGQQSRKVFGFSYRTRIGNDIDGDAHGYKIHIVYGAQASPSQKSYATVNDNPEAINFSWEVKSTPVNVSNHKPTATVVVDSTKVDPSKLAQLEAKLYGSGDTPATLLLPDEIAELVGIAG